MDAPKLTRTAGPPVQTSDLALPRDAVFIFLVWKPPAHYRQLPGQLTRHEGPAQGAQKGPNRLPTQTPRGSEQLSDAGTRDSLDLSLIPLLPVRPWPGHLNFPHLSLSIWKGGITTGLTSKGLYEYPVLGAGPDTQQALCGCRLFTITNTPPGPARPAPTPSWAEGAWTHGALLSGGLPGWLHHVCSLLPGPRGNFLLLWLCVLSTSPPPRLVLCSPAPEGKLWQEEGLPSIAVGSLVPQNPALPSTDTQ